MAQVASGRSVEASGKTLEQAIENALDRIGLSRDQVQIQVLREPSRGVLGFGAHDAIVRVTQASVGEPEAAPAPIAEAPMAQPVEVRESPPVAPQEEPVVVADADEPVVADADEDFDYGEDEGVTRGARSEMGPDELLTISREVLLEILQRMHIIADVLGTWSEPEDERDEPMLVLDIVGDELGLLIGRRGETLRDLQYLVRLIVGHRVRGWANLIVDVEGYKQRRERTVRQLARRMAERVVETNRAAHMEPMNAYERRLVHLELRNMQAVRTKSSGEGERRRVGIFPQE